MTLQQLRYVTAVAGTGTISHAVQQFYISQPSLTNAIRELEQEVRLLHTPQQKRPELFSQKALQLWSFALPLRRLLGLSLPFCLLQGKR